MKLRYSWIMVFGKFSLSSFFVLLLLTCSQKDIITLRPYKKKTITFIENNSIFSSFCKPSKDEIIELIDDEDNIFYLDTIFDLRYLYSLNCYIYTDVEHKYYERIICDHDTCNIEDIKTASIYRFVISNFENVDKLNLLLKEKIKLKKLNMNLFAIEYLIRLVLDAQFSSYTGEQFHILINTHDNWREMSRKYSYENFNNISLLKHFSAIEKAAFEQTKKSIDTTSENDICISFIRKYDQNFSNHAFNDVVIKYEIYADSDGYIQLKKRLMNPIALMVPTGYE